MTVRLTYGNITNPGFLLFGKDGVYCMQYVLCHYYIIVPRRGVCGCGLWVWVDAVDCNNSWYVPAVLFIRVLPAF